MVRCKVFVRWLPIVAQGLRRVENVVAFKESCVLFKSEQHALFISWSRVLVRRASTDRGRISSVGRALDCRAGGRGFDSRSRTDT